MGLGLSSSSRYTPPAAITEFHGVKIGKDCSVGEREAVGTQVMMSELTENKLKNASDWEGGPPKIDNTRFANHDLRYPKLPKDSDGYVQEFDLSDEKGIRAFFEEYGVVVIKKCLNSEECALSRDELWSRIERICKGVDRKDPHTFEKWPGLAHLGILGNDVVLSKQFCENRQNPNVHKAFATLFNTEKLWGVVGRASAMRPTVLKNPKFGQPGEEEFQEKKQWRTIPNWLHWDMDPFTGRATTFAWKVRDPMFNKGYDFLRVQGIVALGDCGPDDGGFQCVPGFHQHIRTWAAQNDDKYKKGLLPGSYPIPKDDPMHAHVQTCPVREGSLLIWDSRIPHCTFPNKSQRGRMIQYIKMAPVDDKAIQPLHAPYPGLLPPDFTPTELGKKIYGFAAWS